MLDFKLVVNDNDSIKQQFNQGSIMNLNLAKKSKRNISRINYFDKWLEARMNERNPRRNQL